MRLSLSTSAHFRIVGFSVSQQIIISASCRLCLESAEVVITGIDSMEILDRAFEAMRTFQPMNDQQVRALEAKTAQAASRGSFEPFKTSSIYDGTAQNPDWLGEEPQRIQQLMSARP